MGREPRTTDAFDKIEKDATAMIQGLERMVVHSMQTSGNANSVPAARSLFRVAGKLIGKIIGPLRDFLRNSGIFDAAESILEGIPQMLQDIVDNALSAINEALEALDTFTDQAIGAVLGLIEAFKKVIHLVLDSFPKNPVSDFIELNLDILNNILGNIAELVSKATGNIAKTFRTNMYDQLYMIRRAKGARAGLVAAELPETPE